MQAIRRQRVDEPFIKSSKIYTETARQPLDYIKKSEKIPIKKGVRLGDTISPKVFTACLEEVFRNLEWKDIGIKIDGEYLKSLRFADDSFAKQIKMKS